MPNTVAVNQHGLVVSDKSHFFSFFTEFRHFIECFPPFSINITAESPATFETPVRDMPSQRSTFSTPAAASMAHEENTSDTASVCSSQKSHISLTEGHSLDSFLSNYTSEDNCSFQELIEKSDKKLRQKFAVLFEAEEETALTMARNLCIPSAEEQCQMILGPKAVRNYAYCYDERDRFVSNENHSCSRYKHGRIKT